MAKKGQRRKGVCVQYDYEAAYQEQLDRLGEEEVKQLLKDGKVRSVYATKEVRSGEQLEVEVYPEFTKAQVQDIPPEGLKKKSRQAQNNLNEKNSRKKCERLINENFGDRDIWATLTYAEGKEPASMKEAKRDMQRYIRRLNYLRRKRGLSNLRYVYVTECSEKGRWHHHIVMDGDMEMDTAESQWKLGQRNEVRRLHKDENGLVGMAKYITKQKQQKGKYQKSWTASKGLRKPKEKVNHYKFRQKDVDAIVRGKESLEGKLEKWYGKDGYIFTSCEIRYNSHNRRFYIYARMRRQAKEGGG